MSKRVLTCEDAVSSIYDKYQNVDQSKINDLFDTTDDYNADELATKLANIVDSIGADKGKDEKTVVDNKIRMVMSSKASKSMSDKDLVPIIIEAIMDNGVYRQASRLAKTDTGARILSEIYRLSYELGRRRYQKYILDVLENKYYYRKTY